jgi:hypothetical protein
MGRIPEEQIIGHEKYWESFRKGKGAVSIRWANHFFEGIIIGAWYRGIGACKYCGHGYKLERTLGNHIFSKHQRTFLDEFYGEVKKNGIKN